MTDGDTKSETSLVLRRDRGGRVRRTPEQRAAILKEFDRSGLSGPQFARVSGVHYQTLATWLKKRKEAGLATANPSSGPVPLFVPATALARVSSTASLELCLPGGASVAIATPQQAHLAGVLLRELNGVQRC